MIQLKEKRNKTGNEQRRVVYHRQQKIKSQKGLACQQFDLLEQSENLKLLEN